MNVSDRFRYFATAEAAGSSALYEELALHISKDADLVAMLEGLSPREHQPNLFFAAVNYLGGIDRSYDAFREFVFDHRPQILEMVRTRRTQTNEVGRCSFLLPAFASVGQPLALIEVGASAGLNLLFDRYAYDYGDAGRVGESSVLVRCEARGEFVPPKVPEVASRLGIDLAPVDLRDSEQVRWLEACIWPDQPERVETFRAAVHLAQSDPPELVRGDVFDHLEDAVSAVPPGAHAVVFHSAVLAYLSSADRERFAEMVRALDVTWISAEGGGVLAGVRWTDRPPPETCFFVGRGGAELLAYAHPHGRWMEWL